MVFELFTRVALREDFPHHKLRRGDVASTALNSKPLAHLGDACNWLNSSCAFW